MEGHSSVTKGKAPRKQVFQSFQCYTILFFFIMLLIGGARAFSYQCNKIFDSENIQRVLHFLEIINISVNIMISA